MKVIFYLSIILHCFFLTSCDSESQGTDDGAGGNPETSSSFTYEQMEVFLQNSITRFFEDGRIQLMLLNNIRPSQLKEFQKRIPPSSRMDKDETREFVQKVLQLDAWRKENPSYSFWALFESDLEFVFKTKKIFLKKESPCLERVNSSKKRVFIPKMAATSKDGRICYSYGLLKKMPMSTLEDQIIALLGHELCHLMGEPDHGKCRVIQFLFEQTRIESLKSHLVDWISEFNIAVQSLDASLRLVLDQVHDSYLNSYDNKDYYVENFDPYAKENYQESLKLVSWLLNLKFCGASLDFISPLDLVLLEEKYKLSSYHLRFNIEELIYQAKTFYEDFSSHSGFSTEQAREFISDHLNSVYLEGIIDFNSNFLLKLDIEELMGLNKTCFGWGMNGNNHEETSHHAKMSLYN